MICLISTLLGQFRIGIGMLFGPVDLETGEMSNIYFLTSSLVQGLRVML